MRELKIEEIAKLASKPNVRKIAVENFLLTMGTDMQIAIANLYLDATLYNWDVETVRTIEEGLN